MMRRPLDRRMFVNPQQRRNMARTPQGILASGPRIMNAAMQQQYLNQPGPILDTDGGAIPPVPVSYFGFDQYPGPEAITGGYPGSDVKPIEIPENVAPALPGSRTPKTEPAAEEPEFTVLGPEDGGTQSGASTQSGNDDPLLSTGTAQEDFGGGQQKDPRPDPYERIFNMLEAQMPEGKSTETYIDEAAALLKKYGIDSGDKKEMQQMRIMEFFLNMAAGKSPDFLENVADAGKETFKGYAKDIRDLNARDQELKLAGIQMGLSEKGKADATRQAINLKKIEVVGDATKELLSLADKSKQVDYLVRVGGKSQEDAIALVYSGNDKKLAFELEYGGLRAGGVSPFLATQIAGNSIDLTVIAGDTNAALNALQGILASGPPGDADLALLGLLTGTGRDMAKQAIIDAGHKDDANRLLP